MTGVINDAKTAAGAAPKAAVHLVNTSHDGFAMSKGRL
jgi:hypothetical protein